MLSPRRVGRYELLGPVGTGGMGEVHRARAFGAAGVVKHVCLKLIRGARLASPDALERFVEEARLSMQLAHGNIVPVFDFGRCDDGYYLAMEWVDGADAGALVRDGPLPPEVAAHVAAEIARALSYAHTAEGRALIHCDVKPSNVLVSRAGDVKLADFGIATLIGDPTRSGTPAYMAPEQRAGAPVDARTDLYALGWLLAEMITGERSVRPSPEHALHDLVERMLADAPAERPTSAAEVARELERFVARTRGDALVSPRDVLAERARAHACGSHDRPSHAQTAPSVLETRSMVTASVPAIEAPSRGGRSRGWIAAPFALGVAAVAAMMWARAPAQSAAARAPGPRAVQPAVLVPPAPPPAEPTVPSPAAPAATSAPLAPAVAVARRRPRPAPARLSLNAIPWASVTIDGQARGTTPLFDLELAPGSHVIRFEHALLQRTEVRRVHLAPGQSARLIVDLRNESEPLAGDP